MQEKNSASQDKEVSKASKPSKSSAVKIAGIASTTMWIIAFALLFFLKEGDRYVWTSDALMLTGFWPVLFVYKAGWTWFFFGILNMSIGFILEVARQLPEDVYVNAALSPAMMQAKEHVLTMHPCLPWIIIGFLSLLMGTFRIIRTIIRTIGRWRLSRKKKDAD
ncbi:MAG TPA: hypothetical protein PKD05_15260 [Candidatus Melainabacteria bacterium]|nr:hypothetical protein [Candidatus Melainabacteria bacterium]